MTSPPNDISNAALKVQPTSFWLHFICLSLNKMADTLADAKLVLPWLMAALGAPAFLIAWLVPIRESLSLLPQIGVASWSRKYTKRKYLWSIGAFLQGLTLIAMGIVALLMDGYASGLFILVLLALFSMARCLCSIIIKDVQGKTIDKQQRGKVSGYATSIAGMMTILFALTLILGWLENSSVKMISQLLFLAGGLWLLAALLYLNVPEQTDSHYSTQDKTSSNWATFRTLLQEAHLRQFLLTRSLFVSTALVAPFYVILANRTSDQGLSTLGLLLLLSGIASFISGWFWGRWSDLSSKTVLVINGVICGSLAVIVVCAQYWQWNISQSFAWYGLVIFILYLSHAGIRLGRATYLMDMANQFNRAQMVALSNTLIGLVVLIAGNLSAMISHSGIELTILIFGLFSFLAAICAYHLPDVSQSQ